MGKWYVFLAKRNGFKEKQKRFYNVYDESPNSEIAKKILEYLGGHAKLVAMIGAKDFYVGEREGNTYLQFSFPSRNVKNKANRCIILYDHKNDLYNMEFWRIQGIKALKKQEFIGIYADNLRYTFENATGLYLSLKSA